MAWSCPVTSSLTNVAVAVAVAAVAVAVAAVAMRRWRAIARVAALSRAAMFIACARAPAAVTAALARRVELTSAVDAMRRTLEGAHARAVFGASAYDGSAFHGHPFVVFAVERIARWVGSGGTMTSGVGVELATASAWLAADSVALALLCALATTVTTDMDGVFRVCALYALNPINAMALMARSNAAVGRACVFASAFAASRGYVVAAGVASAMAMQMQPHVVVIVPALALMCSRHEWRRWATLGGACAATHCASAVLMGDDFSKWWSSAVLFAVRSEDQTPNLGLHWYLFTTMFDHFREFYVVALNAAPLALAAPLAYRFSNRPLTALVLSLIVATICAPYPTLSDVVTYMSLLSVIAVDESGNPLAYMKGGVLIAGGFLYALLLSPITWYMWIHTRVANANFFYAITLVFAITQLVLLGQVTQSVVAFDRARKLTTKTR